MKCLLGLLMAAGALAAHGLSSEHWSGSARAGDAVRGEWKAPEQVIPALLSLRQQATSAVMIERHLRLAGSAGTLGAQASLQDLAADATALADWLELQPGVEGVGFSGLSQGGWVGPLAPRALVSRWLAAHNTSETKNDPDLPTGGL